MASGKFKIVFEQMEEAENQLEMATMKETMIQSEEIRKLIEVMEETMPVDEPIIYSGS